MFDGEQEEDKKYLYIAQSKQEYAKCKIGITNDLERRLEEYNSMTGKSLDNVTEYLFTCEIQDGKASEVENDIKKAFKELREQRSREIYFYNQSLFEKYVNFIKEHKLFKKEIAIKKTKPEEKVIITKKEGKTLKERKRTRQNILNQAKKTKK